MQLDQGACGHEVAWRIQEHGIKWQTTQKQVDKRANCKPEPDSLPAFPTNVPAAQQSTPPKQTMFPQWVKPMQWFKKKKRFLHINLTQRHVCVWYVQGLMEPVWRERGATCPPQEWVPRSCVRMMILQPASSWTPTWAFKHIKWTPGQHVFIRGSLILFYPNIHHFYLSNMFFALGFDQLRGDRRSWRKSSSTSRNTTTWRKPSELWLQATGPEICFFIRRKLKKNSSSSM